MAGSSPYGKKTLWEKEKLLITSNLFFSHSVFKRVLLQTRKNHGLFGKGLMNGKRTDFYGLLGWFSLIEVPGTHLLLRKVISAIEFSSLYKVFAEEEFSWQKQIVDVVLFNLIPNNCSLLQEGL